MNPQGSLDEYLKSIGATTEPTGGPQSPPATGAPAPTVTGAPAPPASVPGAPRSDPAMEEYLASIGATSAPPAGAAPPPAAPAAPEYQPVAPDEETLAHKRALESLPPLKSTDLLGNVAAGFESQVSGFAAPAARYAGALLDKAGIEGQRLEQFAQRREATAESDAARMEAAKREAGITDKSGFFARSFNPTNIAQSLGQAGGSLAFMAPTAAGAALATSVGLPALLGGAALSMLPVGAGEIMQAVEKATGKREVGKATMWGIPYAAIEIADEIWVMAKRNPATAAAATAVEGLGKAILKGAAKGYFGEPLEEVAQDKIKAIAVAVAQGKDMRGVFESVGWGDIPNEYKEYLISMGPGMLLYGGAGAAAGRKMDKTKAASTLPIVSPEEVEAFKAEDAEKLEAARKAKKEGEATAAPATVLAGGIPGPKESVADKAAPDLVVGGVNLSTGETPTDTAVRMEQGIKDAVNEEINPTPVVPKETPEQEKARLDSEKTQRDLQAKQAAADIKAAEIAAKAEADRAKAEADTAREAEKNRIKQEALAAKTAADQEKARVTSEAAAASTQAAQAKSDQALSNLATQHAKDQHAENVLARKEKRKARTIPMPEIVAAAQANPLDERVPGAVAPTTEVATPAVEMAPETVSEHKIGIGEVLRGKGKKKAAKVAPVESPRMKQINAAWDKSSDMNTNDASKSSVKSFAKKLKTQGLLSDVDMAEIDRLAKDRDMTGTDLLDHINGSLRMAQVAEETAAAAPVASRPAVPAPAAEAAPAPAPEAPAVEAPAAEVTSPALEAADAGIARVAEMRSAKVPVSKTAVINYAKELAAEGIIAEEDAEDVRVQDGPRSALDMLESHLVMNRGFHKTEAERGTGRAQAAARTPQAEQRGATIERARPVGVAATLEDAKAGYRKAIEEKLKTATGRDAKKLTEKLARIDELEILEDYTPTRAQTAAVNLAGEVGRRVVWLKNNTIAGGFASSLDPNTIFISVKSNYSAMQVVLHEVKHSFDFEGKTNAQVQDILDRLHASISKAAGKTSKDFAAWRAGYDKQMGYAADDEEAWDEYTAEIFQDAGVSAEFYRSLRNISPEVYDAVMGAYERIVGAILESKVGREVMERILGVETIKTYIANKSLGTITPIKAAEVFTAVAKAIDEMATLVKAGRAGIQAPAEAAAATTEAAKAPAAPAATTTATAAPEAPPPAVIGGVRTRPSTTPEVEGVPRVDFAGKPVRGTTAKKRAAKGKPLEMQDKTAAKRAKPGRAYSFDEDGNMIEAPASNFVSSVEGPVIVDEQKGVATPNTVRLSRYSYEEGKEAGYYERVMRQIISSGIATKEEAGRFIKAIDSISARIFENRDFLDYEPEGKGVFEAMKSNADAQYGRSLDFTTVCRKTAKLFATVSEIMRRNEKGLSAEDITSIRQELSDAGEQVNCAACYVFSRWVNMGNILDNMAEQFPNVPRDLIYDPRRSAELAEKYPAAWAWKKARRSGAGKAIETRTEYDPGEIKRYFNAKRVRVQNLFSGMRMQSWSDFDPLHVIDLVQAVADMASIKLAAHGYTKVADFVRLMAPAGAAVNMSLIPKGNGFDAAGALLFDDIEGMPAAEAFALRSQHSTAGTVAIGISREHILAMMADPRIDYIIPYHASGLSKAFQKKAGMENWSDFTKSQSDKVFDKGLFEARMNRIRKETGMTKAQAKRIMPFEYWDGNLTGDQNAQRFLDYAKSVGVTPRFAQFLNADGTAPSGYWKLLIDRKMYDTSGKYVEQTPMNLNIDMNVVDDIFNRFLAGEGAVTDLSAAHEATVEKFTQKVPSRAQAFERRPGGMAAAMREIERARIAASIDRKHADANARTLENMQAAEASMIATRAKNPVVDMLKIDDGDFWILPNGKYLKVGMSIHGKAAAEHFGIPFSQDQAKQGYDRAFREGWIRVADATNALYAQDREGKMNPTLMEALKAVAIQRKMKSIYVETGEGETGGYKRVWDNPDYGKSRLQAAERTPVTMEDDGGIVLDRTSGVVYVGADLVNVDFGGRQAKTGILYPTKTNAFTVGEGVAKNIQKHIDAGFTTIVIVGYKNLQSSMDANPLFHAALGRALKSAYGPVLTEEIYSQARVKRESEMTAFDRGERKSKPKSIDHLALGIANGKEYSGKLLPAKSKVTLDAVTEKIAAPGWEKMLGKAVGVGEHVSISKASKGNLYPFEIKFRKYYAFRNPVDFSKMMDESGKPQLHKDNRWLMLRSGTLAMSKADHPQIDTLIKAGRGEVRLQAEARMPEAIDTKSAATQRANTVATYRNVSPLLKGRVLDYGAGLGVGSDELRSLGHDVDSFEPNAERWQGKTAPTFTDATAIGGQYDSITNFSVLNVLRPEMRRFVVERIGELLAPGGTAHITARLKREVEANKTKRPAKDGWITGDNVFQKGFENSKELRDYVTGILGDGFNVKIGKGLSGAYITATKTRPTGLTRLQAQARTPGSSEYWSMRSLGRLTDSIRNFQNRMVDVKDAMWSIENLFGKMPDQLNIDMNQKVYLSMLKDAVEQRYRYGFKPILELMASHGETIATAGQYLIDRRIPEFNDLMSTRNPNWVPSTPMTTAEANQRMQAIDPARMAGLNQIADAVDAFRKDTHRQMVGYHLESQATIDAWEREHPSWISFMREGADDYGFGGDGGGQGFNVKGSQGKVAFGSSLPVNPEQAFASLISTAENTLKRGIKNTTVGHATFGAAIMFPNPEFWKAIRPTDIDNPARLAALAVQLENEFDIPQADTMKLFKEDQQPTLDPRTKEAVFKANPMLRGAPHVFATRVNGENRYVFFNKRDERAMAMARALKNQDLDPMVTELTWAAKFTRYYASVSTQWNPFFGVKNLGRDALEAAVTLQRTPLAGQQLALWGHIPRAAIAGWRRQRALRGMRTMGTSEMDRWNNEFIADGGPTGHLDYFENNKERAKELASEMKYLMANGWKKGLWTGGKYIKGLSEDFNTAMENATRLSAYILARKQNMSNLESAILAKELTVNFNDKGRKSSNYNALFAFFNASVQGTATVARTMFEQTKDGKTVLSRSGKQVIAGGMALGALQVMLMVGSGMEPDQPPEWVRDNNFVIPNPFDKNHPFLIPMPLGFSFIVNMGRRSVELVSGRNKEDKAKQMVGIAAMMINAHNPLGDIEGGFQGIVPTPLKPGFAIAANVDWKGQPIARLDFNTQRPTPGYTRARDTATWTSTQLATMLDYISGGDGVTPGAWSPTPDQIDYLAASAVGGLGREVVKTAATLRAMRTGESIPTYKVPLISSYVSTTGGASVERTRYYDNLSKAFEAKKHVDNIAEKGGDVGAYVAEHPEAMVAGVITKIDGQIKKLHAAKAVAKKAGDTASAQEIENAMRELMKVANTAMEEVKK